jgi:hypothetical protein
MVMSSAGLGTKRHFAEKDQQYLSNQSGNSSQKALLSVTFHDSTAWSKYIMMDDNNLFYL